MDEGISMICNYEYNPYRTYIQFGDLVFDYDGIYDSAKYSQDTKTETTDYSWRNGSYVSIKKDNGVQLLKEASLSLTLVFDYKLYRREDRRYLRDWVFLNLRKVNRLWAIQDNHLIWAYAYASSYSEAYTKFKHTFSIDVDFKIPEGVWHISDPHNTFLIPYDSCIYIDEQDFQDDSCKECCIDCSQGKEETCNDCLSECGDIDRGSSLCAIDKRQLFHEFMQCGHSWKVVYNCTKGKQIFGDDTLGTKICKKDICITTLAGKFYSNTLIDTDMVDVVLNGKWQDPTIDINGDKLTLKGDYEGRLHFYSDGTVTWRCDACSKEEEISANKISYEGNFGFNVHHGYNRIKVSGACDCGMNCAWIHVDELTV